MKKSLKCLIAATASVVSSAAFASSNMENPLYMPKNREVYLKTGAAVMYKEADSTEATKTKNMDGKTEFPIWRFSGDIGYGITDRLDIHGRFGYTHDEDISRQGMHRGRVGLTYRVLTEEQPLVLDLYADMYLSGVTPMKGTLKPYGTSFGFDFDNYSNGRYGAIVGTRFGKTWDKFTAAAHVEYLQTFGNHNNKIAIDPRIQAMLYLPNEISVDLKSTHETVAGFDLMYQMDSQWSFGAGFEYVEHYDNGVKGVHTNIPAAVESMLVQKYSSLNDGWDEYVVKANIANQITDSIQLAFFAEYTFDDSHNGCQNGTDVKTEAGFRFNARF